jgi:hypothetical protein
MPKQPVDYRDFMQHLEHLTSGVWADKRCRVCKLSTRTNPFIENQFNTPENNEENIHNRNATDSIRI